MVWECSELKVACKKRRIEQINGHEGETATLLSMGLFTLNLSLAVSPHVISTVGRLRDTMVRRKPKLANLQHRFQIQEEQNENI